MRTTLRRALCLALITYASSAIAQPGPHFDDCTTQTGQNVSLIIPLDATLTVSPDSVTIDPVEAGDELAVVTPEGTCAGTLTWTGSAAALAVWEDDPLTADKDGFVPGDTLAFRLWHASSEREVAATTVQYVQTADSPGLFAPDAVYFLSELAFGQASGVDTEDDGGTPFAFAFEPNYPNPFATRTTFRYAIPEAARVRLDVYDLLGRRVATIMDEDVAPGWYESVFHADGLASGPYIARITAGAYTDAQRIVLVR